VRILFVADVYAKPGRRAAAEIIPRLLRDCDVDFCVVNGENAAGGFGLTEQIAGKLHSYGADVITSGNHVWNRADFLSYLERSDRMLRPLNYPPGAAGRGSTVQDSRGGVPVAVVNLQGRTFMSPIDCPFRRGREEVERLRQQAAVVLVDFHAEATAEKVALAWHLDGLASAVIGTHTHVQTADERILPQGTAFLTDAGMTGVHDSVIGTRPGIAIQRFLTQVPLRFKPSEGPALFCGVLVDVAEATGRAAGIERLQLPAGAPSPTGEADGD
jgi:metallophosphoesterase (TIGR00282 family)